MSQLGREAALVGNSSLLVGRFGVRKFLKGFPPTPGKRGGIFNGDKRFLRSGFENAIVRKSPLYAAELAAEIECVFPFHAGW